MSQAHPHVHHPAQRHVWIFRNFRHSIGQIGGGHIVPALGKVGCTEELAGQGMSVGAEVQELVGELRLVVIEKGRSVHRSGGLVEEKEGASSRRHCQRQAEHEAMRQCKKSERKI